MARTTDSDVEAIIEVDSSIALDPFIAIATRLVDRVEAADSDDELTDADLVLIETWLAAHFYTVRDPRPVTEKAGSVSVTYQSKVALNLSTSHYGQTAMVLDVTGTLRRLSENKVKIGVSWLGTEEDGGCA